MRESNGLAGSRFPPWWLFGQRWGERRRPALEGPHRPDCPFSIHHTRPPRKMATMPTTRRSPNSVSSIIIAYPRVEAWRRAHPDHTAVYPAKQAVAVILATKQDFLLRVG